MTVDARTQQSLAFLDRIDRVLVPSTTVEDDALFLVLDVRLKPQQLTEKQLKKQHRALQPLVDYSTTKAAKTLELVHEAIHDWSLKHQSQSQQQQQQLEIENDDQAPPPPMPQHCAYCSQFNSPAAMELWQWNTPPPPQEELINEDTTGLSVIVVVNELLEFEKCLNSYVMSARNVPEGLNESDCEGLSHIPSILASFLQRAQIKTVGESTCKHM